LVRDELTADHETEPILLSINAFLINTGSHLVLVLGSILMVQEAIKRFDAAGGSIINLSSIVGSHPVPGALVNGQWLNFRTPGIPRTIDGKPNLTAPTPRTPDGKPDLSGLWRPEFNLYNLDVIQNVKDERVFRPDAPKTSAKRSEKRSSSSACSLTECPAAHSEKNLSARVTAVRPDHPP
jgi:NAD(P)-dependent dehydrogenase (short-subunit alcohol dehydrogenase family)